MNLQLKVLEVIRDESGLGYLVCSKNRVFTFDSAPDQIVNLQNETVNLTNESLKLGKSIIAKRENHTHLINFRRFYAAKPQVNYDQRANTRRTLLHRAWS